MKSKHILHLGMNRCASTWLWAQIVNHPDFDQGHYLRKDNLILIGNNRPFSQYEGIFKDFDISANFNPRLALIDTYLIKFLNQYATHASIIFRDPYEYTTRVYSWCKEKELNINPNLVDEIIYKRNGLKYADIVTRWRTNAMGVNFKIMYFEEIIQDYKQTLLDYYNFLDMDVVLDEEYERKVNVGFLDAESFEFNEDHIKYINNEISKFETLTKRDCSHWYR